MFSATKREPARIVLGLVPCLVPTALILILSTYYSLGSMGAYSFQGIEARQFISNLLFSLQVAGISTVISLLLGMLLAIWIWKQSTSFPSQLYTIPLILPHIVAAYFVIVFFSQSGLLSSIFWQLGFTSNTSEFPVFVFDNNGIGIILAYIYKETPFVTLLVLASLRKIPQQLMQTADLFNASALRRFRTILLPQISTSLWISGIIIFMYSFASFDIPFLIGSSARPMVSIEAYRLFFEGNLSQRPEAHLLFFSIWLVSFISLVIFIILRAVITRKEENSAWL